MNKTRNPAPRGLLPLLAALCLCGAATAQPAKKFEPARAQAAEAKRLRGALAGALGDDFGLTRDRLARRSEWHGGGLYWLAHLRARRPGEFHVAYKYRYTDRVRPQDPLYSFVERRTHVRVGPRGCARRPRHNFVCVGDTFILPVVVNDYTEHAFSLTRRPFEPGDATSKLPRDADDGGLDRAPVANPAGEFLKYVGRRAHYMPHRAGGHSMTFEAVFEAVKPGSFNLHVGARVSAAEPLTAAEDAADAGPVPVLIVAPGKPVTVLSAREEVHGYTERFSSRGGENYPTTPLVLQPGERVTLKYSGYSRRGRSPGGQSREAIEAAAKARAPVVTLLPFRVDPARDFNEWIVEILPPSRRE